ncbi:MAG: CidA/LrgA family protein [Campylobacter sp.]|nr:CidA/LrgA family protein [Campylobacter sp.]MBR6952389.1 CidA/LrgA family protein [Campylobacter sp.]MBR7047452.1 CidA/LrgA family protein [Campylobacter sp.]
MKYLRQFTIIIAVTFLAEVLAWLIPAPIPASIYGLVIMFLAFYFKVVKVAWVRETATFFIEIMPVIFIPAGVGILVAGDLLVKNLFPFIVITLVSTIAVIASCGVIAQYFYNQTLKKEKERLYKKFENSHLNSDENLSNSQNEPSKNGENSLNSAPKKDEL